MDQSTSSRPFYKFGDVAVDTGRRCVMQRDLELSLGKLTYELLLALVEAAPNVVTHDQLVERVWSGRATSPETVTQRVKLLRDALGDDTSEPRYVGIVRGHGYRLIPPVVIAPVGSEATIAKATHRESRVLRWAIGGGFAIALSFYLWHRFGTPEVTPGERSIAVLPLTNLSGDQEQDYFADGLTEELLNTLSQIPELRVTARTSAFAFKGRNEDIRTIGKALGTRYVLEASVRSDKARVRVTAQLIETETGYHFWSKTFDRPAGNRLDMQEDIAREVAHSLEVAFETRAYSRITQRGPAQSKAYELYLHGRQQFLMRNREALARAIDYHRQAIAAAPDFALAYAGLADAELARYFYSNESLSNVTKMVEPLIEKGLAIDPKLAELYVVRGLLRSEQLQLDRALEDLHRAVKLNPNHADAYVRLAVAHEYNGEPRPALDALAKAVELDPLHFNLHLRRCIVLQNLGRYQEAGAACARAIELQPDAANAYWVQGLIGYSHGDYASTIKGYRKALDLAPQRVDLLSQLGWMYLDVGRIVDANAALDRAEQIDGDNPAFASLWRARKFLLDKDTARLRSKLDTWAAQQPVDAMDALDLARLELTVNRDQRAQLLAKQAVAAVDYDPARLYHVLDIRFGLSDLLTLALCARSARDEARARAYLQDLAQYLDRLERNGQVWHGLHYLRASVLALQDEPDAAMKELEKSKQMGWRRAWWPRHDPAFKSLRSLPAFNSWLLSIDALNDNPGV